MISVEEALRIILEESKALEGEEKNILSCLNKVLAEDIYSRDNLPPFDKSAMDGYAIKSEDTDLYKDGVSIELEIVDLIKAGESSDKELKNGQAMKIMTGAPVPEGANAVIQIEKVEVREDTLHISEKVKNGCNVIKLGEEIKVGDIALRKGTLIRPTEIGVLASLGYSKIKVPRNPVVSILTTGDELVEINETPKFGQIRNSNEYSLKALIQNLGLEALSFGIVEDKKDTLKSKVKEALEKSDIVITSGGASVGDFDFVEQVLNEINADIKFQSVAIKPGKPISFAVIDKKLFFSLPGNPLSAITTFEEFVKPACEKMLGKNMESDNTFPVILAEDFKEKEGRSKYIYVKIKAENGKLYAYKAGSQSSNQLITMSKANGIIIMPEGIGYKKAGEVLSGKFIFK
ncbi:gephyrin-like molybdotransferase Glp [Clostridium chromiireducens]|uniref:Molybdopterin molybdenumtransferase n=1 Tax=Clostridium chromiireducens TaxID=225345 RepID=A0A1V4IWL4_9CLOT|nr:gephyrin-like molybdotransferase Glp [Clostridium chromiireducens]OPJ64273.1 molybdopterin molybdenumtransferase [Clostridium chromiireducens]